MPRSIARLLPLLALLTVIPGCAAIQSVAALRNVDFALDRIGSPFIAGVDLSGVRSFEDIGILGAARIGAAFAQGALPARFVVHVAAENPADNSVSARLVGMDWSLFLDEQETIAGSFNDPRDLPPGVPVDIPIAVELDLLQFFDRSAPDLVNLVLAIAGDQSRSSQVKLQARPTVQTPIGPIRYPEAITIVNRGVGG